MIIYYYYSIVEIIYDTGCGAKSYLITGIYNSKNVITL